MNFQFKSKLNRHLQSEDHKKFEESLQATFTIDEGLDDHTIAPEVCCIYFKRCSVCVCVPLWNLLHTLAL